MRLRMLAVLAIPVMAWAAPGHAQGRDGIPSLEYSTGWLNYGGDEWVTLTVVPDGSGQAFTAARLPDGTVVDGTVNLQLRDSQGLPIVGYPAEDIWIMSVDHGLVVCGQYLTPDHNTDEQGMTEWALPPRAGGHSETLCQIFIAGMPLTSDAGLQLAFNSPDINGDLVVNMLDVVYFANDYFGDYAFRSDLYRDGAVNLSDVAVLAANLAAGCP